MIELATLDMPGLATISLKTSLSLRCYLCAIKRMDNVTDCGAELGQEHIESGGKRMWKDKSVGDAQIFDCTPPDTWRPSRLAKERSAMIALLERGAPADEQGWLSLAWRLPDGLRSALIKELAAGNWIVSISDTGWPHSCSVVVTMGERFHATRQSPPQGVSWRAVNVPHYWREELSENSGGTEFLLIT
jgi:hypothetical protein